MCHLNVEPASLVFKLAGFHFGFIENYGII